MSSSPADASPADKSTSLVNTNGRLASIVRPLSYSPAPAYALGSIFLGSILIPGPLHPVGAHLAPFLHRIGFGAAFCLAGYALQCGDERNGSGIATSTSLGYLMLHLRRSLRAPRNPLSLVFAGSVLASTALYGSEYFLLQPV